MVTPLFVAHTTVTGVHATIFPFQSSTMAIPLFLGGCPSSLIFPTNRKFSPGYMIYVFLYGIISIFTLYEGD